jgi:hypothetical protein
MLRLCLFAALATLSLAESLFHKIGTECGTDKVTGHAYHHTYNQVMHLSRHKPVKLLEIGLGCTMNTGSASICLWQKYFADVDLWLMDIDTKCADKVHNFTKNAIIIGDQGSEKDLRRAIELSGGAFDFIVDDGSHSPAHQLESFRVLFEHALKPGGTYFIEDIESTSRELCESPFPSGNSRDRVVYWADQFLKFPRIADVDLPANLMSMTLQREMAVFHKCPVDEERCP